MAIDQTTEKSFPTGDWHTDNAIFQNEQTIDQYLILRDTYPHEDPQFFRFGDIEWLFKMQKEVERHGIDCTQLAAVFDADPNAIDHICLTLLRSIADRRQREKAGETNLQSRKEVIPDALIDYLIAHALEAIDYHDEPMFPRSLHFLIRERLGGPNMAYYQAFQSVEKRDQAVFIAAQMLNRGENISISKIADWVGVNKSTISRMFGAGELESEASRQNRIFQQLDEKGLMQNTMGDKHNG